LTGSQAILIAPVLLVERGVGAVAGTPKSSKSHLQLCHLLLLSPSATSYYLSTSTTFSYFSTFTTSSYLSTTCLSSTITVASFP
jgi:hypothetical protein